VGYFPYALRQPDMDSLVRSNNPGGGAEQHHRRSGGTPADGQPLP
jgi:hypothetical protein